LILGSAIALTMLHLYTSLGCNAPENPEAIVDV